MTFVKLNERKNGVASYSPFSDLVDNLLKDSYLNDRVSLQIPAVNIFETENDFQLEVAVPGLKKEDFKLNLEKNVLNISAEVKNESTDENKRISRKEFSFSSFTRAFTLPQTVDFNSIEATYVDGILKITLAKKEEAKIQSREISIN